MTFGMERLDRARVMLGFLAAVAAAAAVAVPPVGVPGGHGMWRHPVTLCRGVELKARALETPRRMKAYVARIDLGAPGLGFTATERAADWGAPMPDYTNRTVRIETVRETTADFLMRRRAAGVPVALAVNASPWTPWDGPAAYRSRYGVFWGWNVSDGVELSHGKDPRKGPFFVVYKDGRADIAAAVPPSRTNAVAFAFRGFGFVMTNGVAVAANRRTDRNPDTPRTVFGLTADRRTLVLLVVDGRQPGYSRGAAVADLPALLRAEGVSDAVNMDGGGSSTLVAFDDLNAAAWTVNRPSDARPRRTALNFGVFFNPPR